MNKTEQITKVLTDAGVKCKLRVSSHNGTFHYSAQCGMAFPKAKEDFILGLMKDSSLFNNDISVTDCDHHPGFVETININC